MKTPLPALSIVLACHGDYYVIAATLSHLRAQTLHDQLELVIVAASRKALNLPEITMAYFWGYQVVEIGHGGSIARANAAGVRHALAKLVALAEDHCFPEPGWAEALVRAHDGPWAAVGPVICNANPESAISWADYLIGYGPWADPTPSGEVSFLPGHNSSYKREVLLGFGPQLEAMLESETVFHQHLRANGQRLYLCAEARTAHVNFSRLDSWLRVQVHNGRVFAAARRANWSIPRRLLYAAASPLIPLVRCYRIVTALLRPGRPKRELMRVLPILSMGLALDGFGQMLGYASGAGHSATALADYEYRRIDHVCTADRSLFVVNGQSSS